MLEWLKAVLWNIYAPFCSPTFYRGIKRRGWLKTLLWVGCAVAFMSAFFTFSIARTFRGGASTIVVDLVSAFPDDLEVTWRKGRISVNSELPVIVPWPRAWQSLVDSWGIVPYMAAFDKAANVDRHRSTILAFMIFTERGVFIDQDILVQRITHQPYHYEPYAEDSDPWRYPDAVLTKELLLGATQVLIDDLEASIGYSLDYTLVVILACMLCWAISFTLCLYVFITSLIGFIVFSLFSSNRNFTYCSVVQTTTQAQIPIWLVSRIVGDALGGLDYIIDFALEVSVLLVVLHVALPPSRGAEDVEEANGEDLRHIVEMQQQQLEEQQRQLEAVLRAQADLMRANNGNELHQRHPQNTTA